MTTGSSSAAVTRRLIVRVGIAGVLAGAVMAAIGLATAGSARSTSPLAERVATSLLSGVLFAVVLAPLAVHVSGSRWRRLATIFVPLYVTGTLADLVEASVFTALLTPVSLVAALVLQAVPALIVALLITLCLPASAPAAHLRGQRSLLSWAWRLLLAGLLYVPAYYGFAALVAPIEHPFYADPAFVAQLQTRTPPDSIIVPLETLRGMLFALALVPVLRVLPSRRWSTFVYLVLIGVVIEAVVPLLGLTSWPAAMRLGNLAELTGDAAARAATVLVLLGFPPLLDRSSWQAALALFSGRPSRHPGRS